MLRRAKTESLVSLQSVDEVQSGPSAPRRLTSMDTEELVNPDRPRSGSESVHSTPSKSASFEDPPLTRPSLSGPASNVRTYGGKSRSFLVSLGPAGDDPLMGDSQEDDFTIRASYNELRERWGVDNSEDDPYPEFPSNASPGDKSKRKGKGKQAALPVVRLPSGMMNDLKSITELRSKGESRRFLDEVGYLFEGLEESSALGVKRTRYASMDLIRPYLSLRNTVAKCD